MKTRRLKSVNRKFKSISSRIQFLAEVQSAKETLEQQRIITRSKHLYIKLRKMQNFEEIDSDIRKRFITLSFDLQDMNSADRMAFIYDDPAFPREEKLMVLNACIGLMVQLEEYEICATLNRMVKIVNKGSWAQC